MLVRDCEKCKKCIYYGRLANQDRFCTFILFNERSRGCPVDENCIQFIEDEPLELEREFIIPPSRGDVYICNT